MRNRGPEANTLIGIVIMALLIVAVAMSGKLGLRQVVDRTQDILVRDAHVSEEALQAHVATLQLRRFEKDYFLNIGAPDVQAEYLEKWQRAREALLARLDGLERLVPSEEDRATLQTMRADLATYLDGFGRVQSAALKGDLKTPQAANLSISQYKDAIRRLEATAASIGDASDIKMGKRFALLEADTARTTNQMTVTAVIAVAVAILIGVRLRAATRGINE
jgi:methyl-accepting chemotaxis protein